MYPEDRVLVAVINRQRDLVLARDAHWYRIPLARMPRGVDAEYIAFFLSRAFGERSGAVHYYARVRGFELAYRRDLLPDEPDHPRAGEVYYRVALDVLQPRTPPIPNTAHHVIAFIHTTWAQFVRARRIRDLYGTRDSLHVRIYRPRTTEAQVYLPLPARRQGMYGGDLY